MNFSESDSLSCACCGDALHTMFDRRRVLRGIGAAGLLAVTPSLALAAPKYKFEAMVLSCIDPRFQKPVFKYMTQTRGLKGQYAVTLGSTPDLLAVAMALMIGTAVLPSPLVERAKRRLAAAEAAQ